MPGLIVSGFTLLTTPMKYLTAIPPDPFADHSHWGYPNTDITDYLGKSGSHHYVENPCPGRTSPDGCGCGYVYPYPGLPPTVSPGGYGRRNPGCIHAYKVSSFGPDRTWDGVPARDQQWPYPLREPKPLDEGANYAPTNGTKSPGDIRQMTGDWKLGYFTLDGQTIGRLR